MHFFQKNQSINERFEIYSNGALIFYIPDSVIIPAPFDPKLAVYVAVYVGFCD
jgi:hypothetical protein